MNIPLAIESLNEIPIKCSKCSNYCPACDRCGNCSGDCGEVMTQDEADIWVELMMPCNCRVTWKYLCRKCNTYFDEPAERRWRGARGSYGEPLEPDEIEQRCPCCGNEDFEDTKEG